MSKSAIINIYNEISVKELDTLESNQEEVNGYIEGIYFPNMLDCTGLINEEGKLDCMPFNPIATALYNVAHQGSVEVLKHFRERDIPANVLVDVIVGNMIVNGSLDKEGDSNDIPDSIVKFIKMIASYIKTGTGLDEIKLTFEEIKKETISKYKSEVEVDQTNTKADIF